jgi:hypothetical protein
MSTMHSSSEGGARARTQQAAEQLKPVAAKLKPLAQKTGLAARRQARKTRAWAAPHVERSGKVLQENVAPKVSEMLTSAAHRIDPANDRAHGSGLLSRLAAFFRGKSGPRQAK